MRTGVFRSFIPLHVEDNVHVNSAFWCFSVLDSSNASNLFCLTVANNVRDYRLLLTHIVIFVDYVYHTDAAFVHGLVQE